MSDQNFNAHYPDLAQKGGLVAAIRTAFSSHNPVPEINGFGTGATYAYLVFGQRSAQVLIGSGFRLFVADFCERGVLQAKAETDSFQELIQVLGTWLLCGSTVTDLVAQHSFCERR